MSLVARVVRSFHDGAQAMSLEHVVALPHMPTMGTWLDLSAQGVEAPLEVVAVPIRAHVDEPGIRQLDADVFTRPEPLRHAALARECGWAGLRDGVNPVQKPSTSAQAPPERAFWNPAEYAWYVARRP